MVYVIDYICCMMEFDAWLRQNAIKPKFRTKIGEPNNYDNICKHNKHMQQITIINLWLLKLTSCKAPL